MKQSVEFEAWMKFMEQHNKDSLTVIHDGGTITFVARSKNPVCPLLVIGNEAPPETAELLLTFLASTSQDEYAVGDMQEIFVRDCAERGRQWAVRRYWSNVLGYLFRRSFRVAALIGVIKKLFVG